MTDVSKVHKTLERILRGTTDANIRFDDLRNALAHLGFAERIRGDHHIFTMQQIEEILNLQPKGSKAKAYQVKQVREVLVRNGIFGAAGGTDEDEEPPDENVRVLET